METPVYKADQARAVMAMIEALTATSDTASQQYHLWLELKKIATKRASELRRQCDVDRARRTQRSK